MEKHRENVQCAGCHSRIDPYGLALENYNAIGAWRAKEANRAIDSSGALPDGAAFKNATEFRARLNGKRAEFRKALVEKLLIYALGRGLEYADTRAVREICANAERQGDRFSAVILAIVESDLFQKRWAEKRQAKDVGQGSNRPLEPGEFNRQLPEGELRIAHPFKGGFPTKGILSPKGTVESLPQVPVVVFDSMFLQQGEELFLEAHFTMMLFLGFDVTNDSIQLRETYGERAIFGLPGKETLIGECFMNPFRGASLDELHGFGNRHCRRQREQQMNMIGDAPNAQGFHFVLTRNATQIRPKSFPKLLGNEWLPLPGAEDAMKIGTDV